MISWADLNFKIKGNTILANVRNHSPIKTTASHPRSLKFSATHNLKSYTT